jgi:hypothetical protein
MDIDTPGADALELYDPGAVAEEDKGEEEEEEDVEGGDLLSCVVDEMRARGIDTSKVLLFCLRTLIL